MQIFNQVDHTFIGRINNIILIGMKRNLPLTINLGNHILKIAFLKAKLVYKYDLETKSKVKSERNIIFCPA